MARCSAYADRGCLPSLNERQVRKIARSIGRRKTGPPWALDPVQFANSRGDLDPLERLVLVTFSHRANDQGWVIGGKWLQAETGLHQNTITKMTHSLERKGRISIKRGQPNRYMLIEVAVAACAPTTLAPIALRGGSSFTPHVSEATDD